MNEHELEPVPGLPGRLPEGERMLWQGAPRWTSILLHVFHVAYLCGYFGVLLAWRAGGVLIEGGTPAQAALAAAWLLPLAFAAIAILALIAWLVERTTCYTITNRRVVMRIGIVLSITFNIPFRVIEAANLRQYGDGSGDIALQLTSPDQIAYLHLWPHARPWHFSRSQPQFRGLSDPVNVAALLAQSMASVEGLAVNPAPPLKPGNMATPESPTLVATQ
jgi:hypothetical protein